MSRWTWTLAAAAVGVLSSTVFSSLLQWPRHLFVAAHTTLTTLLCVVYVRAERISVVRQLQRRWKAGLIVGLFVGALIVRSVMEQPASPRPEGPGLVGALAWYGVVYGVVDALLLSVIPVLSIYGTQSAETMGDRGARFRWALMALLASAVVTALYHLGFAEYRGAQVLQPVLGNSIITLAYLLSGNPLAPILAHVMMHGAAVLHGPETTLQLPPHY
jgi:hypothetical protein